MFCLDFRVETHCKQKKPYVNKNFSNKHFSRQVEERVEIIETEGYVLLEGRGERLVQFLKVRSQGGHYSQKAQGQHHQNHHAHERRP